jgi:hypothetical protein
MNTRIIYHWSKKEHDLNLLQTPKASQTKKKQTNKEKSITEVA